MYHEISGTGRGRKDIREEKADYEIFDQKPGACAGISCDSTAQSGKTVAIDSAAPVGSSISDPSEIFLWKFQRKKTLRERVIGIFRS